MSDYGMRIRFDGSMEEAEAAITEALKNAGFGILTRIDVARTLKEKIDLDRPPYVILGACNPGIAAEVLSMEPEVGLLLPCNAIVYETEDGDTIVSIIEPGQMLSVVGRKDLEPLAEKARQLLADALNSIASK
jgi:uncharacterized protein (DUF302 family)